MMLVVLAQTVGAVCDIRRREHTGNYPVLFERRSGSTNTNLTFSGLQFGLIRKWALEIVYIEVVNSGICQLVG
jgi:hypothetical protein